GIEISMLKEVTVDRVYLAQGVTDLRKSIDGLAALVKEEFELDRKRKIIPTCQPDGDYFTLTFLH
ncbi:IS66 family insertion sequence element accessory protein TnpB, partial [Bacillus sporothermodurans]|uniref:IS66 family insertion sequence element accessory protein TnpB n=1 Tax=Heyndrickxia sporothermodurans TaxID=46224 RepID=UPI00192CA17A